MNRFPCRTPARTPSQPHAVQHGPKIPSWSDSQPRSTASCARRDCTSTPSATSATPTIEPVPNTETTCSKRRIHRALLRPGTWSTTSQQASAQWIKPPFEEGAYPDDCGASPNARTDLRGSDRPSQVAQPMRFSDSPRNRKNRPPSRAERRTEGWAHGGIGSPIKTEPTSRCRFSLFDGEFQS